MRVFEFSGRFEAEDAVVYAVCEHAPLTTQGTTRERALELMLYAIDAYMQTLARRGEIDAGVEAGLLRVKRAKASARKRVGPLETAGRVVALEASLHRFVAEAQMDTAAA